jgi:hypothetical protein
LSSAHNLSSAVKPPAGSLEVFATFVVCLWLFTDTTVKERVMIAQITNRSIVLVFISRFLKYKSKIISHYTFPISPVPPPAGLSASVFGDTSSSVHEEITTALEIVISMM